MILITGAGGKTGMTLVKALANIERVCGFVHREEQVSTLKSLGIENVILGDMHDEDAVRFAMQGIRAVYHICPNMNPDEVKFGKLAIEAARENGVEHFIYHSVLHPQSEKMPHHWQKMRVEEMIFESGLPFTILQPGPYMQNLLVGWKSILEEGVLRIPYSVHSPFSFVDLEDIGEAAKIVLTQPNHKNAIYELVGTRPMSHVDVGDILQDVLKQSIRVEEEDTGEWRLRAKQRGLSEYALDNLIRMFGYYDQWGLVGNSNMLEWLLNREPASYEVFIRRSFKERNAIH